MHNPTDLCRLGGLFEFLPVVQIRLFIADCASNLQSPQMGSAGVDRGVCVSV